MTTTVKIRNKKTLAGEAIGFHPGWIVLDNGHGPIWIPLEWVTDMKESEQ